MPAPALELLDYLHDALVNEISWSFSDQAHSLKLELECDEDCGYPEWNGKVVALTFLGVLRASIDLFGHVAGQDSFDSIRQDISPSMSRDLAKLTQMGIAQPKAVFRIALHSGSGLQVACDAVAIDVSDPTGPTRS